MKRKLDILIYLFENYYFQSWQFLYKDDKGVWNSFQKGETDIQIDNLCKDAQLVLNSLGGMNQGEYTAIIRKFSRLRDVEEIRSYLEQMLDFFN